MSTIDTSGGSMIAVYPAADLKKEGSEYTYNLPTITDPYLRQPVSGVSGNAIHMSESTNPLPPHPCTYIRVS